MNIFKKSLSAVLALLFTASAAFGQTSEKKVTGGIDNVVGITREDSMVYTFDYQLPSGEIKTTEIVVINADCVSIFKDVPAGKPAKIEYIYQTSSHPFTKTYLKLVIHLTDLSQIKKGTFE